MTIEPVEKYIEYFRRCYRADSSDLSLTNITKVRKDRLIQILERDFLACGELSRMPLVGEDALSLMEQSDTYRRERRLVYGCFIVTGNIDLSSGFSSRRKISAPLVYFPANLSRDEDIYLDIDISDVRVNLPLLRLLLKPELESNAVDTFPALEWPLSTGKIGDISRWLQEYTLVHEVEELGRWPLLADAQTLAKRSKESRLLVASACCLVLADRSRGVRGVLHELSLLVDLDRYSRPLDILLGDQFRPPERGASNPDMLPGLLSEAQTRALRNAAKYPLSLVSGPPGTGKSFTIAAMAIDRMLQGESVLIVSKTDQAIDVLGSKLRDDYGLTAGYVHTRSRNFLKSMKEYLDSLLKQGIEPLEQSPEELRSRLKTTRRSLSRLERQFAGALRVARLLGADTGVSWIARLFARVRSSLLGENVLWSFQNSIGELQHRLEKQAVDFINACRLERLQKLLKYERGSLSRFNRALRARTSGKQAELFEETDFSVVLKAFPIWLVGVDELNRVLPFGRSMFDLVIFDESTQCDIASALPALYRGRRATVVGDGKQLRHVSFLSWARQETLWRDCGLGEIPEPRYSYRDHSLLDLVSDCISTQDAVTMLDEHYRSKPELIAFSNQQFYANRLKVMQSRPGVSQLSALNFVKIDGRRTSTGRNSAERDYVLQEIQSHIKKYREVPVKPSIGVLSPFREQAEFLDKEIRKVLSADTLRDFLVLVSTPFGFQGEERDVMFLSMSIDNESTRAAAYLNREDVFNVSITRAKQRQVVVHSIDEESLSSGNLLRRYLSFDHLGNKRASTDILCQFSEEVKEFLEGRGVNIWVGFAIAGQEIDVVCERAGNIVGIDLIGYPGEFVEHFSVQTYKTLYRAGIHVVPLSYRHWEKNRSDCLHKIMGFLNRE